MHDDLARDIQQFLKDGAYSVTSDGDSGHDSKRALAAFQKSVGLPANGDWNNETAERIASVIPGPGSSGPQNEKDDRGRSKITAFSVVDPYNLIRENNELNNLLLCTGYLDCD